MKSALTILLLTFMQLTLGAVFAVFCGWLIGRRFVLIRGLGWLFVVLLVIGYVKGSVLSFRYLAGGDWTSVSAILANIFLLLSTLAVANMCSRSRRLGIPITLKDIFGPEST